jgi:hypothetical protein
MGDTMAISRADLLKELLPGLNELFGIEYKTQEEKRIAALIDQIIHNEAAKQKELEHIIQAGKTFRNDVKIAQIIANEEQSVRYKKELEDAIQKQSR